MKEVHITLLGKENLPLYYPIIEFNSEEVYVLGSRQNLAVAHNLKKVLEEKGLLCKVYCDINAFDIKSIISKCEEIHSKIGNDCNVTYNITGGTKIMAIGAYIVAKQHKARIIYTDSVACIDLDTYSSVPLNGKVDNKTIFRLQGQLLKSYDTTAPDKETLNASNKIACFINENRRLFNQLRRQYVSKTLSALSVTEEYEYKYNPASMSVCIKDNTATTLLDICHHDALKLLFEGRWWEALVADAIFRWSDGRYEIWRNVTFNPRDMEARLKDFDKNEIDILVNTGNKLLFVECKSGDVTQDNINKMSVIRQNYGSDKSKSVLVSQFLRSDLREKIEETKSYAIIGRHALENIPQKFDSILQSIKA